MTGYACQFETSTSSGISIEDSELARISDEQEIIPSENNTFKRGEDVHYILYNVGKFKEGEDGLHWLDMDLEVSNAEGIIILDEKGLLGENGRLKLESGYASSPYGTFSTNAKLEAGSYKIKITIYDRNGKGKATVSSSLTLE